MRLILTSLAICAICLLPALGPLMQLEVPYLSILRIPATFLDYIAVVAHELGHVVLRLSYGYPALPALAFRDGGGVVYPFDRNIWLLFAFYGVATAGFCWGMARRVWWFAGLVSILTGLHLVFAFNYRHEALCNFMGLGAEVFVAAACIIRSARAEKMSGWHDQYFNMVFGMYVMGRGIILTLSAFHTGAAEAGKGNHFLRDAEQIAAVAGVSMPQVALFALGFTVISALTALGFAIFLPPRERLGTIR